MHNTLYPSDWKLRAAACLARAAYRCEDCGTPHGVLRVGNRSKSPSIVYLHAAHVNHDPENPQAKLRALCPSWQIGNLSGSATAVLDAIGSALHSLVMEQLKEQEVHA